MVADVSRALSCTDDQAIAIVTAFDQFVATPLERKFTELDADDIAKRNPFVYAALGTVQLDQWVNRVSADMLSSSAEGLIGNWMEEVARIMCSGTKPGSGVDLQLDLGDGLVELYALQSTTNTKNAGGRRSDLRALEAAAGALRAQRRHVDLYFGYLFGRKTTTKRGSVTHLSSSEFWTRVTGDEAFLAKLLHACTLIAPMYVSRATANIAHVSRDAEERYGDQHGGIDWDKVLARAKPKPI